MTATHFGPAAEDDPSSWPLDRIAPTERRGRPVALGAWSTTPRSRAGRRGRPRGPVRTADDLALYAQMLLNGGRGPERPADPRPLTVRLMIDPGDTPAGQRRGLGWDVDTGFSSPAGRPVRPAQLRPHRVHRHEPLDRPRDPDLRHPPDQPAPPRRQGPPPSPSAGRSPPWPPRPIVTSPDGHVRRVSRRPSSAGSTSWPAEISPR